jgi:hypothetical protein
MTKRATRLLSALNELHKADPESFSVMVELIRVLAARPPRILGTAHDSR